MDETGKQTGRSRRLKVGEWLVLPQLRELANPEGKETVEARSMDVLVALAESAGEVLSRSELLELC